MQECIQESNSPVREALRVRAARVEAKIREWWSRLVDGAWIVVYTDDSWVWLRTTEADWDANWSILGNVVGRIVVETGHAETALQHLLGRLMQHLSLEQWQRLEMQMQPREILEYCVRRLHTYFGGVAPKRFGVRPVMWNRPRETWTKQKFLLG